MGTRIISWQSVVTSADPSYFYNRSHILQYEISNGRLFYSNPGNPYIAYLPLTKDDGTPIESGVWHNLLETNSIPVGDLMPGAALVHGNGQP